MNKTELVLPAGDLEKLKVAAIYGADAVYLGGKQYSLRAFAGNFDDSEMAEGIKYMHSMGKKAYVTVNIVAHNRDLQGLPAYLEELQSLHPDALIISDPGVMRLALKYAAGIPLTLSTQANVCNYETAAFYEDLGISRLVLARELDLAEIELIRQKTSLELEMFIHGAMCVAYSGRCLLSQYMTGRSANRGECAHPCRYRYALQEEKRPGQFFPIEEDDRGTYILNSRDLCLLEHIPRLIDAGIDAFKVEGRMKSPLYVASAASIYRKAVDYYCETRQAFHNYQVSNWKSELSLTATRPFTSGFLDTKAEAWQDVDKADNRPRADFCAVVKGYDDERNMLVVEQRANFGPGEPLEVFLPDGEVYSLGFSVLYDQDMQTIDRARHPQQIVLIPCARKFPPNYLVRRRAAH